MLTTWAIITGLVFLGALAGFVLYKITDSDIFKGLFICFVVFLVPCFIARILITKCPNCGEYYMQDNNENYCRYCGEYLPSTKHCPNCNDEVSIEDTYCHRCGYCLVEETTK